MFITRESCASHGPCFGYTNTFLTAYSVLLQNVASHNVNVQNLKVPKRENFSLAFFALSEPIWVCELGNGEKNRIFYRLTSDLDGFWFFVAY
jgi:hypothetical protein